MLYLSTEEGEDRFLNFAKSSLGEVSIAVLASVCNPNFHNGYRQLSFQPVSRAKSGCL